MNTDDGSIKYPDGLIFDERCQSEYQIKKNDSQSANISIKRYLKYYYENSSSIDIQINTESIMFTTDNPSTFQIIHQLNITNQNQKFFNKKWNFTFQRKF